MPRQLRAKLPNGVVVSIEPFSEGEERSRLELVAEAERLAASLDAGEQVPDLIKFLTDTGVTVFQEADLTDPPSVIHGPEAFGADLMFNMRRRDGVGLVKVRSSLESARQVIDHDTQVRLKRGVLGRPVEFLYTVGGRDPNHDPNGVPIRGEWSGVVIYSLSWDAVFGRVIPSPPGGSEPEFRVLLVDMVSRQRQLLRRLSQDPRLLAGIDDRQFEEMVATLMSELGAGDVTLTPPRQDGGRDIELIHVDPATGTRFTYFMECKHWVLAGRVTTRFATRLLDVSRREKAAGAVLLSSSGFGPQLLELEASLEKKKVYLKDSADLFDLVNVWQRQYGSLVIEPVDPRTILNLPDPMLKRGAASPLL